MYGGKVFSKTMAGKCTVECSINEMLFAKSYAICKLITSKINTLDRIDDRKLQVRVSVRVYGAKVRVKKAGDSASTYFSIRSYSDYVVLKRFLVDLYRDWKKDMGVSSTQIS